MINYPMTTNSCILLALILIAVSSSMYSIRMTCKVCKTLTNCAGGFCYFLSGDLDGEVCADIGSSCTSLSMTTNIKVGLCSHDISAGVCSSGMCMLGATNTLCYDAGGYCLNGLTVTETCYDKTIWVTQSGGYFTTPYSTFFNLGIDCPFTSAVINYHSCAGDGYGTSCSCCTTMQIEGISTSFSATGTCVPTTSPIYKIKSAVVVKTNADAGKSEYYLVITVIMAVGLFLMI